MVPLPADVAAITTNPVNVITTPHLLLKVNPTVEVAEALPLLTRAVDMVLDTMEEEDVPTVPIMAGAAAALPLQAATTAVTGEPHHLRVVVPLPPAEIATEDHLPTAVEEVPLMTVTVVTAPMLLQVAVLTEVLLIPTTDMADLFLNRLPLAVAMPVDEMTHPVCLRTVPR